MAFAGATSIATIWTQIKAGYAALTHKHSADDVTSGTLPIERGGTGATSASEARTAINAAASVHTHTPSSIGASAVGHTHAASAITSGTLPIARGGTGAATAAEALTAIGAAASDHTHTAADVGAAASGHKHAATDITSGKLPIEKGGTGASTAYDARTALGAAGVDHTHVPAHIGAADIVHYHTMDDLTGDLPISKGGTGASTAGAARTALGAAASDHTHTPASIGAAAASHTHTPASIGASAASHTHTPASIGAAATEHTHDVATQSAAGFLSAADKQRLDELTTGMMLRDGGLASIPVSAWVAGSAGTQYGGGYYAVVQAMGGEGYLTAMTISDTDFVIVGNANNGVTMPSDADVVTGCEVCSWDAGKLVFQASALPTQGLCFAVTVFTTNNQDGRVCFTPYAPDLDAITPESIGAAASGHTHAAATQSAAGMMSAADKAKLDGLSSGGGTIAPVLLWSGSWTSGSITVPNFSNYQLFIGTMTVGGNSVDAPFAHLSDTTDCSMTKDFFGSAVYSLRVVFEPSGNVLTIRNRYTSGQTSPTVTAIYGIL